MDKVEKLKLELKMYHFPLTFREVKKEWENDVEGKVEPRSSYHIILNKILKIVKNPRGSLRLLILSGSSHQILNGEEQLLRENDINPKGSIKNLETLLKKGRWVVRKTGWYSNISLTNCKTKKDAREWAEAFSGVSDFYKAHYYSYGSMKYDYQETITTTGLKNLLKRMENGLRMRKTSISQNNAAQDLALKKIVVKELSDHTRMEFKDLSGHTYTLKFYPNTKIRKYDFLSLVHANITGSKASQLLATLWEILRDYQNTRIEVNLDSKRKIELQFINHAGAPSRTLLNGKRVKSTNGHKIVEAFFLGDGKLRLTWNEEEERLLKGGLVGTIRDQEGATAFILALEKKKNQWFLCSGKMRVHVKGGMGMIQSLETVLKGTSTKGNGGIEFLKRLSEITGMDRAVRLLDSGKETGKILGSLKGQ